MARFIARRLLGMLLTMLIVSIAIFLISEIVPGDVSRHILGPFATPEQVELFRAQLGLEEPMVWRYIHWLAHGELPVIPLWQLIDHLAYSRSLKGVGSRPVSLYQSVEQWQPSTQYAAEGK